MEYRTLTAKTVQEAITQACVELGVTSDKLDYEVVQESSNGFLGIGAKPAIIRACIKSEKKEAEKQPAAPSPAVIKQAEEEAGAKAEAPIEAAPEEAASENEPAGEDKKIITSEEIEKRAAAAAARASFASVREGAEERREKREPREGRGGRNRDRNRGRGFRAEKESRQEIVSPRPEPSKPKPEREIRIRTDEEAAVLITAAEDFLKSVFSAMEIEADIHTEYNKNDGSVCCSFSGDEMGILIGKRGQTLDSLQYLTSLVVNKAAGDYVRVKLDTEDYRARRADTLNNLARNIAYKVKKTRRPVALEPMNPYERRIIHSSLQSNKFVETYSEGEEPYRHVVVAPKR